jgi:hypothetical protein
MRHGQLNIAAVCLLTVLLAADLLDIGELRREAFLHLLRGFRAPFADQRPRGHERVYQSGVEYRLDDVDAVQGLDGPSVVARVSEPGTDADRVDRLRGALATVIAQLAALMGAIWGVHLVASALKGLSAGLSTALTAAAQGALAWYATLLVARAAERYLAQGKSWGPLGPKRVVQDIVASLDRDSVLREARAEILRRLK